MNIFLKFISQSKLPVMKIFNLQSSTFNLKLFSFLLFLIFTSCQRQPEKRAEPVYPGKYLEEITIRQLQDGYKSGKFTITQVVKDYLARIEAIDKNGPGLNAVICVNPDAMQIAEQLQKEWNEGNIRGPLHGIPVILKDNIDTHDKMPNTAGSTALRNSFPASDSWVAAKLREAGAIIIAKSNLSEWANFRASLSSSGWSGVGGQTHNPYEIDRNPCGSSSGSGVAVSANLCAFAIGTETNGSIVCPSNNNGIVGLKPTVGLLSRSGIIPISFSQDTPGPMGRTVEDVAVALGPMVGVDSSDTKTLASEGHYYADYTQFLKPDGLRGKRIGLLKASMGFHWRVDSLMMATVAWLKDQGVEVVELDFNLPKEVEDASFQVLLFEFKDGLNKYFQGLGANASVKDVAALIEFNKTDSVELRYFDQKLLEMAQAKGGLDSPEYQAALSLMLKGTRENGIDKLMAEYKLDALMLPTGTPAWKTDLVNGDLYLGGNSSLAAIAGYPNISVPMGFIDGLPVGVSFFGAAWSEPKLFEIAYSFEQGTKVRVAPEF
jgi:amidase